MRRTWGIEVLACPRCDARMELIAVIEDQAIATKILRHLGLPTRPPPRGPPWRAQATLALAQRDGVHDGVDAPAFEQ